MPLQLTSKHKTLKGQVYQGKIIKESNGISIQYKITSSYATSGSPVFNESGHLIAINYTSYEKGKDYNFGITAKRVISIIGFNL